jgi:hypothetical protein
MLIGIGDSFELEIGLWSMYLRVSSHDCYMYPWHFERSRVPSRPGMK